MRYEEVVIVKDIICDYCGYYDGLEKFPNIRSKEGRRLLKKFGYDFWENGVGVICPICGNSSGFDFDPDNDMLERIVRIPIQS